MSHHRRWTTGRPAGRRAEPELMARFEKHAALQHRDDLRYIHTTHCRKNPSVWSAMRVNTPATRAHRRHGASAQYLGLPSKKLLEAEACRPAPPATSSTATGSRGRRQLNTAVEGHMPRQHRQQGHAGAPPHFLSSRPNASSWTKIHEKVAPADRCSSSTPRWTKSWATPPA